MTKRRLPMAEHADTLSLKALRELVTGLGGPIGQKSGLRRLRLTTESFEKKTIS
ncbi:hypothetical protein AB4Z31_33000 [Rhizobium sp. 2TAF27]